jgi:hypothetical protein
MKRHSVIDDQINTESQELRKGENPNDEGLERDLPKSAFWFNPWVLSFLCLLAASFVWLIFHLSIDATKEVNINTEQSSNDRLINKARKNTKMIIKNTARIKKTQQPTAVKISESPNPQFSLDYNKTSLNGMVGPDRGRRKFPDREMSKNRLDVPNIGGVSDGSIKGNELLKFEMIESGSAVPISSYMVGYYNGTTDVMEFVEGNRLSEKLKHDLVEYNTGEVVFFTEMYVLNSEGKWRMLPPIKFKILPN